MSEDVFAKYNGGGFLYGIRAKDLSRAEFEALDPEQQAQVESSTLYTIAPAAPGRTGKKADPAPEATDTGTEAATDAVKEQ